VSVIVGARGNIEGGEMGVLCSWRIVVQCICHGLCTGGGREREKFIDNQEVTEGR
jgi:hypothetical protein